MTLPPVVRIFFAIDMPASAKEKIGDFISSLKKQSRTHGIRWSKPENLHITLQFLGQVQAEHLPTIINEVKSSLANAISISSLTIGSLHLFPNPYRPRVIVLNIDTQNELAMLSKLIGQGIQAANYEIENRQFRAHLTLGRIKQPQGINLNFLSTSKLPELENIEVKEVVLFRSEPQPEGSQYTVIEKIILKNKNEEYGLSA